MRYALFSKFIFLFLFTATISFSQVNYKFHKLGVENGLSQNVVTSIAEDKQGFLWFGTMSGLNKYDGYSFKSFHFNPRDTNSLAESWINNLYCSKDGAIWAATRQGGLNRIDPVLNKITRFLHEHNRKNSISENIVTCVIESSDGKIWAGTTDGLNVFDGKKDDFKRFYKNEKDSNSLAENWITSLHEDADGNIWIGSNKNCLTQYIPKQNKFIRHRYTESSPWKTPNIIKSITTFSPGIIMMGTNRGLHFFDAAAGKFVDGLKNFSGTDTVLRFDVSTICKDKDGKFWCGIRFSNYAFIFSCVNPADKTVSYITSSLNNPESISYETMNTSLCDKSGVIWIGFNGKGINYFHPAPPKFFHLTKKPGYPNYLSSEYIYAIHEDDDGSVWIGTSDRGVNHYFPSEKKMEYFDTGILENNWCSDFEADEPGKLWMSFKTNTAAGGVILFDTKKGTYQTMDEITGREKSMSSYVIRVLLNEKDVLWIGTADGGLNRFDKKTKTISVYKHDKKNSNSISGDEITDIYRDSRGKLWIGTRSGLNWMDEKNQSFTNYVYNSRDTNCLSSNYVLCIHQDAKNNLWITTSHGIDLMNTTDGTFKLFSTDDGLPDNFVYGMLEDREGNFWISTNNGLSEFNPKKNSFRNFAISDGLQSKEFNTHAWHKGKSGKMYFGGIGGLNIFNPDSIHDNPYIPPVMITSLSIFGKEQMLDSGIFAKKSITLNYSENFISFDFASLDYLYPEKNEFSCQLEGFDKDWIVLGHRHTISYSNLDPGEYVLHVKATNDDGLWNEVGTKLKIIIPPPFYKTNLFYFLCAIFAGAIVYLTYRNRVKKLVRTKELLEAQVSERTSEIEKQKEEISASYKNITEISEIGQKITSSLNLEAIMNTVYEGVNKLMDGKFFGIALYDEKNSTIEYQLFINNGKRLDNTIIPLDQEDSLAAWCVRNRKELITHNKAEIDVYVPAAPLLLSGDDDTSSIIMLPLLIGKKCIGVITVQSMQENAFSNFHLETMRSIASYTSIAMDNAQLYENLEEIVHERTKEVVLQKEQVEKAFINTRILSQIGQQVTSTLDFEKIFSKLYESVNKLMDAQCFGIRIYYPDRNAVEYSFEFENGIRSEAFDVPMTDGNNYTVWCIKHNKEIFINDNEKEFSKYVENISVPWGNMPSSLIFCPLRVGKRVIGVITVQSFTKNVYTDYHLDILQTLATYTAIALDNAELYNKMENKVKERTSEIEKQKEELQLSNQNISALSEIGQKITSSLNLDAVLEKVNMSVNAMMDGYGFGIATINQENGNIEYDFYIENGKRIDKLIIDRNNKGSFSVWCVNNLEEVHLNEWSDYSKYLEEDAVLFGTRTESLVMIPLIIEKKCVGIIQVKSMKKSAYNLQHIEMLRSIASYTAIALANAQVFKIITEAKAELEKLSIVAQKTDNGVIICDATGTIEWVNEGFSRMTGYTLEEIKKEFGRTVIDISYNPEIKKLLNECMETKHSVFYEELNKTKDGREIWVHTSLTPILDENGDLKKLVAIDSDISEMKKAETALKKSEEQYRILFDRNGDFIFIYDKATHFILDCNQTFIDVYGYSKAEIRKMTPFDLHPMEEQNYVAMNIDVESPEVANYYTHITKTGRHLQVEARSVEIEFNGRHAWLVITRDVTERKKSEEEIRKQRDLIEAKNKDITDSINYAKRIQSATLATDSQLKNCFNDHFVFFRPRDIVSGDFYWMNKAKNGNVFLATADCTGHGVPGAIMSVIGTTKLDEIISQRKTVNPAEALNLLRGEIIDLLNPEGAVEETDDGIDMVLCNFIQNGKGYSKVEFACANNPLWLVRDGKVTEYMPDKFCVGKDHSSDKSFTKQSIDLLSGDVVYTFTDGYADQFGGPKGKKFKYKKLQELLLSIHKLPMEEQKNILAETMDVWQGDYMQIDDICVIGVKI